MRPLRGRRFWVRALPRTPQAPAAWPATSGSGNCQAARKKSSKSRIFFLTNQERIIICDFYDDEKPSGNYQKRKPARTNSMLDGVDDPVGLFFVSCRLQLFITRTPTVLANANFSLDRRWNNRSATMKSRNNGMATTKSARVTRWVIFTSASRWNYQCSQWIDSNARYESQLYVLDFIFDRCIAPSIKFDFSQAAWQPAEKTRKITNLI